MTSRERLIAALSGRVVDRAPFIVPGGLVNSICGDVAFFAPGVSLGQSRGTADSGARLLAEMSLSMAETAGFESLGLPLCMTLETEAYGGEVEEGFGGRGKAGAYVLESARDYRSLPILDPRRSARLPVALETLKILRRKRPDMPLVADLAGPVSLVSSLLNPAEFLKTFAKDPIEVCGLLDFLASGSIGFLEELARAGADVAFIMDPASTGAILGADALKRFSAPYLNKLVDRAHGLGLFSVVHLCGTIEDIAGPLRALRADAISVDSCVDIAEFKRILPDRRVMGNVCSTALERLTPPEVLDLSAKVLSDGTNVLAPTCRMTKAVKIANLRAMGAW